MSSRRSLMVFNKLPAVWTSAQLRGVCSKPRLPPQPPPVNSSRRLHSVLTVYPTLHPDRGAWDPKNRYLPAMGLWMVEQLSENIAKTTNAVHLKKIENEFYCERLR